ncbi:MAG: hypothetical protein IPN50_09850 [Sphingomonadales bacterium]|uniref:hypothetical protein n=1 Tax=Sphingorhabdus sp. TaxID=1902408 RepID=UPI003BAE8AD6|nr:hypothetical protein [Sphingomonadales bacterium]
MTELETLSSKLPARPRLAGGIFLLIGPIIGIIGGIALREPSLGMIAGLAGGGLLAVLVWLFDRKRG